MSYRDSTIVASFQYSNVTRRIAFTPDQSLKDLRNSLKLGAGDNFFTIEDFGNGPVFVSIEADQEELYKLSGFNNTVLQVHDASSVIPKDAKLTNEDYIGYGKILFEKFTKKVNEIIQQEKQQTRTNCLTGSSLLITSIAGQQTLRTALKQAGAVVAKKVVPKAMSTIARTTLRTTGAFIAKNINIVAIVGFATLETICVLIQYSRKEITGKKCAKDIVKAWASQGAAVGVGLVGAAVGGAACVCFGPGGILVGAGIGTLIGGITGSLVGRVVSDRVLNLLKLDDIKQTAKEELLKNARDALQVTIDTPWEEVIKSWREKILFYHPDKHLNASANDKVRYQQNFIDIHQAFCYLRENRIENGGDKTSDADIEHYAQLKVKWR